MDEAKNQVSDLEHKGAKNNQSEQQENRIQKKNKDSISCQKVQLQEFQHLHYRGARGRERARNWKSI